MIQVKDKIQKYTDCSKKIVYGVDSYLGENKEPKLVTFIATFITFLIAMTGIKQAIFIALASLASMYLYSFLLDKYSDDEK